MPRYSDQQLIQILQKAARRVNRVLELFDTNDEISVDASGCITPSDGTLEDLVLLQAECMLSSRDMTYELNTGLAGVNVTDGEQSIDTRNRGQYRSQFFNSPYGPCAEAKEQLKLEGLRRAEGYDIW